MATRSRIKSRDSLQANVLGLLDSTVMAVAGTAPAYSIAASTAALAGAVALAGPAALLFCAIPMFGIAWAFNYLNRIQVNAGATYLWVGRVLHPVLGFLAGWALIMYATIFMVAGSLPAGSVTIGLFSSTLANNVGLVTTVGAVLFLAMVAVVIAGIRLSIRAQWILSATELTILVVFAILAIVHGATSGLVNFSWSWFGIGHFASFSAFVAGALIATFYYSGWDVSSNLGEETKDARKTAGIGGMVGVVVVFGLFVVYTITINMILSPGTIQANSANVLAILGERIWPGAGGKFLVVAVILSTVAGLLATILQVTRQIFAMSRDRTLPAFLSAIHPRWRSPWLAAITLAVVATGLFVASNYLGSLATVLSDAISAIGLMVAFYYGLAGLSVVVAYRHHIFRSVQNFLFIGLLPLVGAAFLLWVFIESIRSVSGTVTGVGFGALGLGLIPMIYYWARGSDYFRHQPRMTGPDPATAASGEVPSAANGPRP
jgi:amino acid transporter